jgi:hypothetical protein
MAASPETSFSLLLPDSEPPFPDDVKEVLADLTFYCATFKMCIPFAPDRLNFLSWRQPCGGPRRRCTQDCALAHQDRAPCPGSACTGADRDEHCPAVAGSA